MAIVRLLPTHAPLTGLHESTAGSPLAGAMNSMLLT